MLTSDQLALQEATQDFADEQLAPHADEWDATSHFPVDVLRQAAEMGLGGIYINSDVGGSELTRQDAVVVFEALATGCPTIASYISIHNMAASMIDRYGTEEQRQRYLPSLCTMEHLASYCLTEPGAGSDAAALRTSARRTDDGWVLNGVKQFISGAGTSQVYVVLARTGDPGPRGISAFIVEKDTPGLSFGPDEKKMGWNAQPTRQVIFEDAQLPADALLGEEGKGFRIAMSALDGGRINIAAASLGGARKALEQTVRYATERETFGTPLSGHQALRFRMADMKTDLEVAWTFLLRAAGALDARSPDATMLCAMAKQVATDNGFKIANEALQLHGGYGYLSEYGVEKIVRDLRVHQILEGTNEIMRVVIARSILGGQ
ncbi:MAG TPA: acyl-CoA dehydrogenase [Intrasporangiaceae bacterium]|nr:acyl-CoA dehydrogenase [Intrasporangiaceae bacterium]